MFPVDAPTQKELKAELHDNIMAAQRYDSLAMAARDAESVAPVSESDAPVFRSEAFKCRRFAQGLWRHLQEDNDGD